MLRSAGFTVVWANGISNNSRSKQPHKHPRLLRIPEDTPLFKTELYRGATVRQIRNRCLGNAGKVIRRTDSSTSNW